MPKRTSLKIKLTRCITYQLFRRIALANLQELVKEMGVLSSKKPQQVFPIDLSQTFHYNNKVNHLQGHMSQSTLGGGHECIISKKSTMTELKRSKL